MIEPISGSDKGMVLLIIGLLNIAMDKHKIAKQIITEAFKYDPSTVGAYLDES